LKGNIFSSGFLKKQQVGKSIISDENFGEVGNLDAKKDFYKNLLTFDDFLSNKLLSLHKENSGLEERGSFLVEGFPVSFQNYMFFSFFEEFFIYFSFFIFFFIKIYSKFLQKDLKNFFFS
jgi:hypothetical protein